MEPDGRVKRNESIEEGLPENGDEVSAHGGKEGGVSKHHCAGCTTSDRHSVTSDTSQGAVLSLNRVICDSDGMLGYCSENMTANAIRMKSLYCFDTF